MPLDPQAVAFLDALLLAKTRPIESHPPAEARRVYAKTRILAGIPDRIARTDDYTIGGVIPIRVYTPARAGRAPHPGLVFYHGGGWVLGDIHVMDAPCHRLAKYSGATVVSVGYRLAPEHRFPIPLEDCYTALKYVHDNAVTLGIDRDRLAVGGDSAGGNLAAAVAMLARARRGPKLRYQMLAYPVTSSARDTRSYREFAEGYELTRSAMDWFWSLYLARPADGDNPLASPLKAKPADLKGLPPALVMTAEYDVLRDEGEAYAAALAAAGVPTERVRVPGLIHGFFGLAGVIHKGRNALNQAAASLKQGLAPAP